MIKFDHKELFGILQITSPFVMIDNAFDIIPGVSANSQKELKNDDWFFECHLKREQAMPGTLQVEAMLQTLVLSIYCLDENKGKVAFVTDSKTKFFKKVAPNSILYIETNIISNIRGIVYGNAKGFVNGQIVCQGEFKLILPHKLPKVKI